MKEQQNEQNPVNLKKEQLIKLIKKKKNNQTDLLRTMTINVLFDTRCRTKSPTFLQKYHIKSSDLRFSQILQEIQEYQPHAVTFNQVTLNFIAYLNRNQYIQQNYIISNSDYNPITKYDVQGNLVMVRKQLQKQLKFDKLILKSHNQPVHIAFFKFHNKIIAVASVHLLAYKNNTKERQTQLTQIVDYFTKNMKQLVDIVILQGDMNFHSQQQNVIAQKLKLRDCWLEKYNLKDNPGYTFDSQRNYMINQLYWGFQKRRMRLDRIFVLEVNKQQKQIKVQEIKLVLDHCLYNDAQENHTGFMPIYKSLAAFLGDVVGINIFRNKQQYLFPSDHFGLLSDLRID